MIMRASGKTPKLAHMPVGRADGADLRRLTTETVRIRHAAERHATPGASGDQPAHWRTDRAVDTGTPIPPVVSAARKRARRAIPRQGKPKQGTQRGAPAKHIGTARVPGLVQLTRRIA